MQNTDNSEFFSQRQYPAQPVIPPLAPTPNDPPWNSLEAFGSWVFSVLLILILPTLFLLPYLATLDPPMASSKDLVEFAKSDPTSVFLQIVAIIPAHIFTILLAWLVVTRAGKFPFRKMLGWEVRPVRWWHYVLIVVGFFVLAAIVGSLFPEQENDVIRLLRSSRSAVYIIAIVATFSAPLVEEVVYRGLVYSSFQRTFGVPAAFVITTLLFALVHVPQYWPSYSTIFLLLILSLVLTGMRVKTKNLLPCIILHMLFNGLQSVGLLLDPFLKQADKPTGESLIFHLLN